MTNEKKITSDPFISRTMKIKSIVVKTAPVIDDDNTMFDVVIRIKPPFVKTEIIVNKYNKMLSEKKMI